MKLVVTAALVLACAACGADLDSTTDPGSDTSSAKTCDSLAGNTYVSVVDHRLGSLCGSDNGSYSCVSYSGSWSFYFDEDGSFYFSQGFTDEYGDGDNGSYSCTKNGLSLIGSGNHSYQSVLRSTTLYVLDPDSDSNTTLETEDNAYEKS